MHDLQVYVPTAAYCLDPKSTRPLGDQRRRARYDAKKKAALLAESFAAKEFSLLELGSHFPEILSDFCFIIFIRTHEKLLYSSPFETNQISILIIAFTVTIVR